MSAIGIPRALSYYDYFPLWRTFFEELGQEVVASEVTNKLLMEAGLKRAVDETCLPVKVYMGHVLNLRDRVDYLFIPRLVSLEEKHFNCPKLIGLPDMVRGCLENLPPILEVTVDLTDNKKLAQQTLYELGRNFSASPRKVRQAYAKALLAHRTYRDALKLGLKHEQAIQSVRGEITVEQKDYPLRLALLSHPYNICDSWSSNDIITRLEGMGVAVITTDSLPLDYLREKATQLLEHIFWTFEKKLAGAALHFLETREVDGIILVVAFECGPDSLVAELIEMEARDKLPIMTLTMDEHTGEAGFLTRLEAFVDMIKWQKTSREVAVTRECDDR
ncbi:MAG TPA: acyl-CoA dehydratase activase-related protein [Candidatus Deferrimicrobium sp.]|nr:acyl-CoA dehydratase activase-related protein [Candidatus Deferrimicrobium sp.]